MYNHHNRDIKSTLKNPILLIIEVPNKLGVPKYLLNLIKVSTKNLQVISYLVLEKTLESPWDCKKIKPVNSKGNLS